MATQREIIVRLRAEIADYQKAMAAAAKSTDALGAQNKKTSKDATVSAEQTRQAWTTTGTALLAVGVAITGIGIAAAKTGISYNTLQQTSRAALTTLLGSSKAANEQMDKLDVFARTSPFSKAVFITAQQQLIGFGRSAKDVIPILDAIQNAVAAVGGSNDDVAQLAQIIAKIGASGKITAEDLNQFGQRGVDAATLIGSQMGKTGAQIREEITKGTIGADDAITALTTGMMTKFGGAADNVKATFSGATDRVKAAWRDLSGELTAPLVGPLGGGLAITGLNKLADGMRSFQSLPTPVKITAEAVTGLLGAVGGLGGGFMVIKPKIESFNAALNTMHISSKKVWAGIGIGAGVLAVAGVAFEVWAQGQAEAKAKAAALTETLDKQTGAITDSTGAWIRDDLVKSGAAKTYKELGGNVADLATAALGSADAMARVNDVLSQHNPNTSREMITGLFTGDTTIKRINLVRDSLDGMKTTLADGTTAWQLNAEMAGAAGDAQAGVADATAATTVATQDQIDATKALAEAQAKWLGETVDIDAGFVSLGSGYDAIVQKNKDMAQATADGTKSSGDSWQTYYDGFTVNVDGYLAELQRQVDAQNAWELNMLILSGKVSQGVLDELKRLGPEGAPLVAQLTTASDAELTKINTLFAEKGGEAPGLWATALQSSGPLMAWASANLGATAAAEIAKKLAAGTTTVAAIMTQYGLTIDKIHPNVVVKLSDDQARARADQFLRAYTNRQIPVVLTMRADVGALTAAQYQAFTVAYTKRATGGLITGPGTTTSDSIPALVSNREYIVKADAVQHYGPAFFDSLNAMRFASGGHVGSGASTSGTSAAPAIYVQNPFTGEYLLAQVANVADARASAAVSGEASAVRARPRR